MRHLMFTTAMAALLAANTGSGSGAPKAPPPPPEPVVELVAEVVVEPDAEVENTAEVVVEPVVHAAFGGPTPGQIAGIDSSPRVQANGRLAEAGPDHGDLPPDPTMASPVVQARVEQVLAGEAHEPAPTAAEVEARDADKPEPEQA